MLALLEQGLTDDRAGRFLFGTESCLPVYSARQVHAVLFASETQAATGAERKSFTSSELSQSWLCARHTPESKWELASCFLAVDSAIVPPQVRVSCLLTETF